MADSEKDADEMSERSDTSESVLGDADGDGDQQDLPHPWPYLKDFFDIVGSKHGMNSNKVWERTCSLSDFVFDSNGLMIVLYLGPLVELISV